MATAQTTANLDQFETKAVLPLLSYGPGTYNIKMMIRGNSLLSSLFVKAIDPGATVTVNYFDTTTGTESTPERYNLASHGALTSANDGETNRIIVTRFHNKPQAEIIVSGGSAEVGVYVTVVTDFPQTSPYLDGQSVNLAADAGDANVLYDQTDGKFYLARGASGLTLVKDASSKASPKSSQFPMAVANTEYALALRPETTAFSVINDTAAVVKASWQVGESGTEFFQIFPGTTYDEKGILAVGLTLYLQANQSAVALSVVEWI